MKALGYRMLNHDDKPYRILQHEDDAKFPLQI
jgi:hypothetical protein